MKTFTLLPVTSLAEASRECAKPHTALKDGGVDLLDSMNEGLDSADLVI